MTLQGMIFDFDGTLGDTLALSCETLREVTERQLGLSFTDAEIVALFGPSEEGIFQRIAGDRWQDCQRDFLTVYERDHHASATIFPGIPEVLETLAERDVQIAIVTGKSADSVAISLRLLELTDHFAIVESGSPEGSVKPAAIRRIVERWALPPDQVAYIGDAPSDVREARAAGVIPLAAAWAATADHDRLNSHQPAALFSTVEQLHDWILQQT